MMQAGGNMATYENDIFISYSHLDNQPFSDEDKFEWITEFHKNLAARLARYMGEPPRIWRDNRGLRPNEDFTAEIHENLPKSAVMLSIFSPRYLKSEWCERELKAFTTNAERNGGIKVKNKFRIFKIIKTPLAPHEQFPAEVRDATGYTFYKVDDNDRIREFDKSIYPDTKTDYYLMLDDLAQDIYQLLSELREKEAEATPGVMQAEMTVIDSQKPTVYVALPPADLKEYHHQIKRELQARGYEVVPQQEFHGTMAERATAIKEYLEQAELSVHFFGEVYDGIARMQNDLAAEQSGTGALQRLIWIPRAVLDQVNGGGSGYMDPAQVDFLNTLQSDESMQVGAELVSESLDLVTTDMLNRLVMLEKQNSQAEAPNKEAVETEVPKYVYVVGTLEDKAALKTLKKLLMEQGVEVRIAKHTSDGALQEDRHHKALQQYDSVLVYWDAGDEDWLEDTLDDINQHLGDNQRTTPLLSRAVLLAGESTDEKEDFVSTSFHVLPGTDGLSPTVLQPLLDDLNATNS